MLVNPMVNAFIIILSIVVRRWSTSLGRSRQKTSSQRLPRPLACCLCCQSDGHTKNLKVYSAGLVKLAGIIAHRQNQAILLLARRQLHPPVCISIMVTSKKRPGAWRNFRRIQACTIFDIFRRVQEAVAVVHRVYAS
jgi:hypothetical protein